MFRFAMGLIEACVEVAEGVGVGRHVVTKRRVARGTLVAVDDDFAFGLEADQQLLRCGLCGVRVEGVEEGDVWAVCEPCGERVRASPTLQRWCDGMVKLGRCSAAVGACCAVLASGKAKLDRFEAHEALVDDATRGWWRGVARGLAAVTGRDEAAAFTAICCVARNGHGQGRKRVIQRRFNVGVLEVMSERNASTL